MKAILQWVLKTMMKDQTGVMRTLPKKDLVDFNVAMTAERLARNGIDPNALKNANQVENAIRMIDDRPKVQEGITATKSAKVMDMKGKEIDPRSKIMGGTQSETEAEIAERLSRENKEGISRIRERQKMIDNAIENQSPGFSGDRKVDAALVAEEMAERMGKVYDDLPIKEQTKIYGEAFDALSKKRFDEDFAQGGRAGFANGTGAPSITYDFDKEQERMGPSFETNDPKEALKEIVRRMINVEPAKVPLSEDMSLMFDLNRAQIGGSKDIGGGQLNFGINKGFGRDDTGIGFEFRKQFASGGITALKSLLNYFAKQRGTKGSQQLKDINPKSVPSGIMNIMGPEHRKMLERNQTDYLESLLDTIKSDKKFLDRNKEIAKQVQKDIDEAGFGDLTTAEKMLQPFIESAMKGDRLDRMKVYDKINVDDAIVDIEQMIKNRRMRESDGRALNASGGRIGLKDGMDRRTFMKIMGGLATLPIVGKLAKGAKLAAPAAKKVAQITAPALDKIIETVMSAGKLVSQSGRRLKELTTKKKLKDIEVEEDMMDGPSYTIKTKDKTIYYKPGKQDEMGIEDDIIEVIEDTVTKKASGGVARMLGE